MYISMMGVLAVKLWQSMEGGEFTFQTLIYAPAPNNGEHRERGQKPREHHSVCCAIIAVMVLAKNDPHDHQHQDPEPMEQGWGKSQKGDIIGGK